MAEKVNQDGLTKTQAEAWDWLCGFCPTGKTVKRSPYRLSTWRAMEKKGWVSLFYSDGEETWIVVPR